MVESSYSQQKSFTPEGDRVYNVRYVKEAELESGSFATLIKAEDCHYSEEVGGRFLSAEHCALV